MRACRVSLVAVVRYGGILTWILLILVPGLLAVPAATLLKPELPSLAGVVGVGLPALMLLVLRDAASWRCRHFEAQLVDAK